VATPGIHAEVLEVRDESGSWEEFESQLLEKYGHNDALRLSKRDFMEWVETPGKGRSASTLLWEFEDSFARLSALDRTVLDTSRVLLFVKSVEKIGSLLKTDDGLTADWAMVKRVCGRFDKRRDWADADSVGAGAFSAKKVDWADADSVAAGAFSAKKVGDHHLTRPQLSGRSDRSVHGATYRGAPSECATYTPIRERHEGPGTAISSQYNRAISRLHRCGLGWQRCQSSIHVRIHVLHRECRGRVEQ
jgi:hypothetical protein